ncbi:MAG: hypothetical protein ACO3D8_05370, partial [Ilumatobacteraceae bacterium]
MATRVPLIGAIGAVVQWRVAWWVAIGVAVVAAINPNGAIRAPRRWLAAAVALTALHGAVQWHWLATPHTGEFSGVAIARSDAVPRSFGGFARGSGSAGES